MTKTQEFLAALPDDKRAFIEPVFDSVERLYEVVYLIARNEHITDLEKPERFEERLQVIREMRKRVERLLTSFGLEGEELVADIASDYFEDFVAYREPELTINNEQFIDILRRI